MPPGGISIVSSMRASYQSRVVDRRLSSGVRQGELTTIPTVQVCPFSLSRLGLPFTMVMPELYVVVRPKLFGSASNSEMPVPPAAVICAAHSACSFAWLGLRGSFTTAMGVVLVPASIWARAFVDGTMQGSVPAPLALAEAAVYSSAMFGARSATL